MFHRIEITLKKDSPLREMSENGIDRFNQIVKMAAEGIISLKTVLKEVDLEDHNYDMSIYD